MSRPATAWTSAVFDAARAAMPVTPPPGAERFWDVPRRHGNSIALLAALLDSAVSVAETICDNVIEGNLAPWGADDPVPDALIAELNRDIALIIDNIRRASPAPIAHGSFLPGGLRLPTCTETFSNDRT